MVIGTAGISPNAVWGRAGRVVVIRFPAATIPRCANHSHPAPNAAPRTNLGRFFRSHSQNSLTIFPFSAHSQIMGIIALSELLGAPVLEASGARCGRVREVALTPAEDRARVSSLIVRTKHGDRILPFSAVASLNGGVRAISPASEWASPHPDGFFLLERDLLDQQIIDVHGRKVVRVNDVDLHPETAEGKVQLKIGSVDVGTRGAVRRLLKGVVPMGALRLLLEKIPPRLIPWEFVVLIETDPARRVKLKISHELLAKLHPADIADIVEELAPDEREAVFE